MSATPSKRRGELNAVVIGAGAVGAALALALARDGFSVALVEARAPRAWRASDDVDLRVVALAPDTRDLLADLDVWPAIAAARVSPYRHMRVWDAQSSSSLDFDAADRGEAALGWIVENKLVQSALWDAVSAHPNVRLVCPGEVSEVENANDGISVTLADGTVLRARVAIAADGAESRVRELLGIAFDGRDYGQRGIVAHVEAERSHESTAWQRFLPGGPLAFLPLADGRCSIVWSRPDDDASRLLALDDATFCAELGAAFDFRLGAIRSTSARAAFPLRMRRASRYVQGRCALAGDAAHVVHPLAGQGMNLGFRDVRALRETLRAARERGSDLGATHVLRRYERERRSENALAARGMDVIERAFGSESPSLAALRGVGVGFVDRVTPIKRWFADAAAGRF